MNEAISARSDMTAMTDRRGFLADLAHPSCPIPKYAYQGKEQFLKDLQHELTSQSGCEWLILTEVTKEIFEGSFSPAEEHPPAGISSYNNQLELLLLRMAVSTPHEAAVHEFGSLLRDATARHGLKLRAYGGDHPAGNQGKVPDEAWRPLRLPKSRTLQWPTVVLEVSFSETRTKLMSDIRYWLGTSNGDVKVVLTVSIERRSPKVIIEQWVMKNGHPGREQRIAITKSSTEVKVSEDALELAFERVFLCPPSSNGEAILSAHAPALKSYAEAIWEQQGFLGVRRF